MENRVLRTAVIGLGRIGWQFHAPQVAQHPGFDLVAVVDPLQARLDEAHVKFDATGYTSTEALFGTEELDLVVIASPTNFHATQAIAAFEHGIDVFCDKPMAATLADVDAMIAAMHEHGRKLMIYQPHRGRPETVALRDILHHNLIGPVYMMKRRRSDFYRRNDWQAFRKHSGGMLNNYGAHYIDQLLYLADSRAKRITCALRTIASLGDADDVVKAVIEMENGVILDVDISMAAAQRLRPWHILGTYGSAILDEKQKTWQVRYYRPENLSEGITHEELVAPQRKYGNIDETIPWEEAVFPLADYEQVNYYQKCYEFYALDMEPFVPIEQTRELMRVLDACRKDAAE